MILTAAQRPHEHMETKGLLDDETSSVTVSVAGEGNRLRCFPYITGIRNGGSKRDKFHHQRSQSYSSPPYQSQPQAPLRPTTALPADNAVRPTRSRSRLQKRPSARILKTSSSAPAMARSPATFQRRSFDQQDLTALPQFPDQSILDRSSSLRQRAYPQTADRVKERGGGPKSPDNLKVTSTVDGASSTRPQTSPIENTTISTFGIESLSSTNPAGPVPAPVVVNQRTPRHLPLAPNDPSPLNPLYHITSPTMVNERPVTSRASAKSPVRQSPPPQPIEQVLPSSVRLGTSALTEVGTHVQDAITQDVVREHTVEIIQEEVTREIHVHHYYTHVQPIKAVEILPARHFLVDEQTGQKVEIPTPEGWVMPESLQPPGPDGSNPLPVTKQYLANEPYPEGVLEPPPLNIKKKSAQELRSIAKARHAAKWSPFPKVG
ncbi:uncharacterized protein Z518_04440 [Rhinocladiella mackenziei CBS 650.93]|uniref:Rhinocladiella mackenziei CBS 650.93 unplaced genomic scaffold supercont1.3, whole genome shotgun sequence n=1 Tax=Rhinocladiella mackenziei CBS 650.93 TaxID=1442369 RepID=A0A0D2IL90_9EURO|nr:uncharacterized protein Z518_04440 [Rhinocladiella mackenziei CBS 650.93]KIX06464.1 hypothetical protein Z518_04440 [Rhinocladiella mackenziei CBS 650.93]